MRRNQPIWTKPDGAPRYPSLDADLVVDVAVVGAGITGLTTALLLADAGKRVAVLEAHHVGAGVTGCSTAHATEVIDTRYYRLESRFGQSGAAQCRASSREAIETIAGLCSMMGGELRRVDGYLFSEDEAGLDDLETELLAAQRAGAAVEVAEVPLPFRTQHGLRFANQAELDPVAYLAGLSERFVRGSGRIFEHTLVVDCDDQGRPRLETEPGPHVVADAVIFATHAPATKPTLQLQLAQYRSYVVAGRVAAAPEGLFWDTASPYHYVRSANVAGASYVLVGGADHRTGKEPEAPGAYQELEAFAARLGVLAEARWSAQVVESADGLPFIGKLDPDKNVYVATGFGGNGITFGTLAAKLIADSVLGQRNPYAELYRANRYKPLASLRAVVTENVDSLGQLVSRRVSATSSEPVAQLAKDEARIVTQGDERVAVYRDLEGKLHAVSAVCTHQGCLVAWNRLERSWDCPCHGSRFDTSGRVLDGPATRPLKRREL